MAVKPVSKAIVTAVTALTNAPAAVHATILLVIALLVLFISLYLIVKVLKSLVLTRVEAFFGTYIFRNAALSFVVGLSITALVQSSSVTTSLVVPIAAAGLLTLEQIFPYTVGANVGTTITAILASLATVSTGNMGGVTIAFSHLLFNVFGILFIYPVRFIPIGLAREFGKRAVENRFFPFLYVVLMFFYLPGICIYLSRCGLTVVGMLLLLALPIMMALFGKVSKTIRKKKRIV